MTELEKITYAKSFIDKLANGINPLDDLPIPEGDLVNNVRLSRCFFYVSGILQGVIERERRKTPRERKPAPLPFSITAEQLQNFEYTSEAISATAVARKINWLVREDISQGKMERFSYRKINYWLHAVGLIEWREWESGKLKRFPTPEGESIGLILKLWGNYGRQAPVIYFTEDAQRFIIDNFEAVLAAERGTPYDSQEDGEAESEDGT